MQIGAIYDGERCRFTVWAPERSQVELELVSPKAKRLPLQPNERGYWQTDVKDLPANSQYYYRIDGGDGRPDPASRFQPEGVHGPSQVVDHSQYDWQDGDWQGIALQDYIIYELHVGAFTPEGSFDAVIPRLGDLLDLGISAVEIMPVAQFPGSRNWGYDGVLPFAVQNSYGGPEGLKRLVDACHQAGLAVIMDVVYNHFGPEGNYTGLYGPYVTDKYRTPWGSAINFDDAYSSGVRNYVIQNVLCWFQDYHIDALRLDAIHAIYDFGAKHLLLEMSDAVLDFAKTRQSPAYLIAESDLNDARIIRSPQKGGYGIDAQWSDDFHHAMHTLLTRERTGYYEDFGTCEALALAIKERFVYAWKYSSFRQRYHGSYVGDLPSSQFVVCVQNHDQVGNRMMGDRLTHLVSFEALKLAAGALLLSPYIPMLFMGEEYGEESPFLYFVDHGDPNLIAAVRKGRKEEFKDFHATGEPPDAASLETLKQSTLQWEKRGQGQQGTLYAFYKRLIGLRKQLAISTPSLPEEIETDFDEASQTVQFQRQTPNGRLLCLMNFSESAAKITLTSNPPWQKQIDSAASEWGGLGSEAPETLGESAVSLSPQSVVLYAAVKT